LRHHEESLYLAERSWPRFRLRGLPPARISADQLAAWSQRCDWKLLLNTRGTTWRKLAEEQRRNIDESRALQLMAAHPSLIKRPVIDCGEQLLVGFDRQRYASELMALMAFPESTETE
jgi:arsenate reductase